jgi:hypothetical protein
MLAYKNGSKGVKAWGGDRYNYSHYLVSNGMTDPNPEQHNTVAKLTCSSTVLNLPNYLSKPFFCTGRFSRTLLRNLRARRVEAVGGRNAGYSAAR